MLAHFLVVAVGSGAGGALRYAVSLLARNHPSLFPYWTFAVNVAGGFLIGYLSALPGLGSERNRLLLVTGFCGGFTTFSAFSLETLELFRQGRAGWAVANVLLNTVCAVGMCWIGYLTGR